MNVKHKLEVFSKIALSEAEKKSREMIEKLNRDFVLEFEKETAGAKAGAAKRIADETAAAELNKSREIAAASMKAKKTLVDLRQRLTDDLFAGVGNMLLKYADENPAYINSLVSEISETAKSFEGFRIAVYMRPRDAERIKALFARENVEIAEGPEEMLGGFKAVVEGRGVCVDKTFARRLAEARENFSGISITE